MTTPTLNTQIVLAVLAIAINVSPTLEAVLIFDAPAWATDPNSGLMLEGYACEFYVRALPLTVPVPKNAFVRYSEVFGPWRDVVCEVPAVDLDPNTTGPGADALWMFCVRAIARDPNGLLSVSECVASNGPPSS